MLPDREDVGARGDASLDRQERVVRPRRQVDDGEVGALQRAIELGRRPGPLRLRSGELDAPGQPVLPDQVLGEDRDPRGQPRVSAR